VTDYDTGLMWETKDADLGGFCLISPDPVSHCVIDTYAWADAQAYVSSTSPDGLAIDFPFLAAHSNWRLPTIEELRSIVDTTVAGCGFGAPCIDPIFGPTVANFYWSATTIAGFPNGAWLVNFGSGNVFSDGRSYPGRVRAVRAGL